MREHTQTTEYDVWHVLSTLKCLAVFIVTLIFEYHSVSYTFYTLIQKCLDDCICYIASI